MTASAHRSLRGRLFGRLADYARRYLTASLEHRLTLVQDQLNHAQAQSAALERQLASVYGVLDRSERNQAALMAMQADTFGLLSAFGPRFDELELQARPFVALDEETFAKRLRDGYVLTPRDNPGFALMLADATSHGLEPGVRKVLAALALPGMVVADVGANVGLLTLTLARAVGPSGRVFAFEPEPGPRRLLERMAALNGLAWVRIMDCAVGARTERRDFHVSPILGHSSLYALPEDEGAGSLLEIEVQSLDDALAGQRLDVAKIDVEGAELDVLRGMRSLIAANPDIALVAEFGPSHLERIGITPDAWFEAFAAEGLQPRRIDDLTGACRAVTTHELHGVYTANLVFVRPGSAADGRLPQ